MALLFIRLVFLCSTDAYCGDYLGDICWNFTNDSEASGVAKPGFTHIGGNHILCSGVIALNEPIKLEFLAYGNIEYVNEQFVLTLTLAGVRINDMGVDMVRAILSPYTLNGVTQSIGVYSEAIELGEGTFQFIEFP